MFYYMGLEPYEERYTLQLQNWAINALKRNKVAYRVVPGEANTNKEIRVGQVLDAVGRSNYSLSQIQNLLSMLSDPLHKMSNKDIIFFEDMFSPGIEALPYFFNQIPENKRPKVFVRCLAQTIDPDDFVNKTGMQPWMHQYERMVVNFVDGILCSTEEMVANAKVAGWHLGKAKLYNVDGLTFNAQEVRSRVYGASTKQRVAKLNKHLDVAFASRLDSEKNPHFLLDVVSHCAKFNPNIKFEILQGSGTLKSDDKTFLKRLAGYVKENSNLSVRTGLKKNVYYSRLAASKVLFNTSLQDWVSNTASEADALGCKLVLPAYRSFPECTRSNPSQLYIPWSVEDAVEKLVKAVNSKDQPNFKFSDHTSKTMDRIIKICKGQGADYERSSSDYRKHAVKTNW